MPKRTFVKDKICFPIKQKSKCYLVAVKGGEEMIVNEIKAVLFS